jgi:hypothetical protein
VQVETAASPFALAWLPLYVILPSLVAVLATQKRARTALGETLAMERPGLLVRRISLCAPQAIVLAIVLFRNDFGADSPAECLMLGILLAWLAPGPRDAILGEHGVQSGWFARRFEDLAEWQLTGSQLRFRLHDEWLAVPCPPTQQPRIRETLLASNAAGESRRDD